MESLQGWADELTKNGKGQDLLELLTTLPLFHKLRGIGVSFSVTIDDIGKIELAELEELAKAMPTHPKAEQESESVSSNHDQDLLKLFKKGICIEVDTYHRGLTKDDELLGRLYVMSKALTAYLENANAKFVNFLKKIETGDVYREGFHFYESYQKQIVDNYVFCVIDAVKGIERKIYQQLKKDRLNAEEKAEPNLHLKRHSNIYQENLKKVEKARGGVKLPEVKKKSKPKD